MCLSALVHPLVDGDGVQGKRSEWVFKGRKSGLNDKIVAAGRGGASIALSPSLCKTIVSALDLRLSCWDDALVVVDECIGDQGVGFWGTFGCSGCWCCYVVRPHV